MPNPISLLTSFSGRIGRGSFWLGLLMIVVGVLVGTYFIQPSVFDITNPTPPPPSMMANIWSLLWFIPSMAITVKRCNDRDWPSYMPIIFGIVCLPIYILPFFGYDLATTALTGGTRSMAVGAYALLMTAVGLFFLIDNGFLRGTIGPNQHGPDPVGAPAGGRVA